MDTVSLLFYAVVCGLLSLASPVIGAPLMRIGIGAVVGIAAAMILPGLRQLLGL